MAGRTDSELIAALEAMCRLRPVESPPDADGLRMIWHRALTPAELVSWVDRHGRVLRQELMLFDDVLIWERGKRVHTAALKADLVARGVKPSDSAVIDAQVAIERVGRVTRGLSTYKGADPFITHLCQWLGPEHERLTLEHEKADPALSVRPTLDSRPAQKTPRATRVLAISLVALLVVATVALSLILWR